MELSGQFASAPRQGGIRGWFKRPETEHDSKQCSSCGMKFCTICGGGPECPGCGTT